MTTARAISTSPLVPTVEETVRLLNYLFDRAPGAQLTKGLDGTSRPHVRTVSAHGVDHAFFNPKRALQFFDSGQVSVQSGRRERTQILLLPDASWLLARRRTGMWGSEPLGPSTMHYHTAELLPAFEECEIQGRVAITGLRRVLAVLNPHTRWSQSWTGLQWQVEQIYKVLV